MKAAGGKSRPRTQKDVGECFTRRVVRTTPTRFFTEAATCPILALSRIQTSAQKRVRAHDGRERIITASFRSLTSLVLAAAFSCALLPRPALAEATPGVIQVRFIAGDVGVQRGDATDYVAAARNAPLLVGDILSTGDKANAEIRIGHGARVRLDENTQIRPATITADGAEIDLAQGTVEMRVTGTGSTAQIDTPSASIAASVPGTYFVTVTTAGATNVTTRSGSASVTAGNQNEMLAANRSLEITGEANSPSVQPSDGIRPSESFVTFYAGRDGAEERSPEMQPPLAAHIDGADELDGYGRWVHTTDGQAWAPNEPPGWTPYGLGQWAWEPGLGWTWVGSEPWGWAPYHYGSWTYEKGIGWAWIPGGPAPWAPALVAFVRTAAAIAWLPLGPHDPRPVFFGSRTVIVTDIARYHNVHLANAFVRVSVANFEHGNFAHVAHVDYRVLGNVHAVEAAHVIAPTHLNMAFSAAAVHRLPPAQVNRSYAGHPVEIYRTPIARPAAFGPNQVRTAPEGSARALQPMTRPAASTFGPAPATKSLGDSARALQPMTKPAAFAPATTHSAFGPRGQQPAAVTHSSFAPSATRSTFGSAGTARSFGSAATTFPRQSQPTVVRPSPYQRLAPTPQQRTTFQRATPVTRPAPESSRR
jgi:hypothetical protein